MRKVPAFTPDLVSNYGIRAAISPPPFAKGRGRTLHKLRAGGQRPFPNLPPQALQADGEPLSSGASDRQPENSAESIPLVCRASRNAVIKYLW
jgi:hypothetical protein